MKRILLGIAASAAIAAPAFAADMPPRPYAKAPPPYTAPALVYNWTGFYIGGHVGGAFAGSDNLFGNDARFLGGVQGGFDYQFAPNWVMGIEAQYVPVEDRESPDGLVARRRARYVDAIGAATAPTDRITERERPESDTAFVDLVQSLVGADG